MHVGYGGIVFCNSAHGPINCLFLKERQPRKQKTKNLASVKESQNQ